MPCLRCGGKTEGEALLCDSCADETFVEPKFFLNPILIGQSLFSRLRDQGSAGYLLGPTAGSDYAAVPSTDLQKYVVDTNIQGLPHDELKGFYLRCNAILAHLGVPIKLDSPQILLTEDAADTMTAIVQKVNAAEKMYPLEGLSDLYIRMGLVYWAASHGILLRTASEKWSRQKKSYIVSRAKDYFSKVNPADDLYSIAVRDLGMVCLDAEEWTAAEENLASALRHFPNDIKIAEGLARAHLKLGNQMEALSRIDEAISIGDKPELWVLKGKILMELDRHEEALECFNRALSVDPKYLPGHDALVEALKQSGRLEEASLAENQRALAKRPDLEQKINEMISEFKRPSAVKAAEAPIPPAVSGPSGRFVPSAPGVPGKPPVPAKPQVSLIDLAREALKARDYETAAVQAEHVIRANRDDDVANLILIEALIFKGDMKQAEPKVHAYYERHHEDPKAWHWRGEIAKRQGKWGAAIQYFSKAVTFDPKMVDSWVSMGETLLEHEKLTGADESFSRVLEIDPRNSRAWLGKGKALKALGRWGAAVQCLDNYNVSEPKDSDAWVLKADLLFEREKYKRAVEAYEKYMELVGDDSYALGRKGISLNALGQTEESRQYLEEAVRLDPENKEAARWLKTIKGAS